jgi:hypothetical protein
VDSILLKVDSKCVKEDSISSKVDSKTQKVDSIFMKVDSKWLLGCGAPRNCVYNWAEVIMRNCNM